MNLVVGAAGFQYEWADIHETLIVDEDDFHDQEAQDCKVGTRAMLFVCWTDVAII
ncbi:hypothetical protein [Paenibacillus sp. UMB4589-SE434]|uniref:hypothetical protein n=1 Tax=Paenibacillus sp. UMB4589-SE434 TaxID=3046314 RepID=UPI00254B955E|nr:hypothetical protein [Paenibacillus sp. UMB4589-SE434]MDK8182650.1 hypothetical protein [Paenibacillus sp. UMB4589-SE434]